MTEKKPLKLKLSKKPLKLKLRKKSVEEGSTLEAVDEPIITAPQLSFPAGGGLQIILKNAKIHADKVIIKKVEKK
ncbi:MAG: hypothetical protein ABH851_05115 [Methanobacteriota archaeon]